MAEPVPTVVLDARTTTPHFEDDEPVAGEPTWEALRRVVEATGASLTIFAHSSAEQVVERATGKAIIITNKIVLTAEVLAQLPDLRYVGLLATGTNAVDLEAAKRQDIAVRNAPAYSTHSVAQHAFALLLELTNRVGDHASAVEGGRWASCNDFSFMLGPLHELAGRKLGVVGYGDIGQRIAAIGSAFGMDVLVQSRTKREGLPGVEARWMERDALFAEADVVSLSCPLTPETTRMIDAPLLSRMKPTSYLINTARGGLVDEEALASALRRGVIAGAGLDVLAEEPPVAGSPLVGLVNCLVTPHIAWATQASRRRLMGVVVGNLEGWLRG